MYIDYIYKTKSELSQGKTSIVIHIYSPLSYLWLNYTPSVRNSPHD